MGILKAIYQIDYARQPDQTFYYSIQFWGL